MLGIGKCEEGEIPSLRDYDIVERFVGFAKAGEADSDDHCLSTLLLERKVSMDEILVGLRLHIELVLFWD